MREAPPTSTPLNIAGPHSKPACAKTSPLPLTPSCLSPICPNVIVNCYIPTLNPMLPRDVAREEAMVWWCSCRAVVETADRLIQVIRTYSGAWRLQRLLPGGFGFSPPRLGHLSKALARRGANLSPRFGGGLRDHFAPRCFAHLVRWAAAILARAALLIFRRLFGAGLAWADTPISG